MRLRRVFSLGLLVLAFSCAGKKELMREIQSSSHVMDNFYKGGQVEKKPISTKDWEKAVQGSYEDGLGFMGRREIKVRVKDEERLGDF
jgi:glutathione synthase/RimK-type ligase-like ATP-grasp enzyme